MKRKSNAMLSGNLPKKRKVWEEVVGLGYKPVREKLLYVDRVDCLSGTFTNYGTFARVNIKADKIVGEYTGKKLKAEDAIDKKFSMFLSNRVAISAIHEGSETRFINHSSIPNVIFEELSTGECVVIATKDIKEGEQLLIDYGFDFNTENYLFLNPTDNHRRVGKFFALHKMEYDNRLSQFNETAEKIAALGMMKEDIFVFPKVLRNLMDGHTSSKVEDVDLPILKTNDSGNLYENWQQKNITPLMYASFIGKLDWVTYLLTHNANSNLQQRFSGHTAFYYALLGLKNCEAGASEPYLSIIKNLLVHEARIFLTDENDECLFNMALELEPILFEKIIAVALNDAILPPVEISEPHESVKDEKILLLLKALQFDGFDPLLIALEKGKIEHAAILLENIFLINSTSTDEHESDANFNKVIDNYVHDFNSNARSYLDSIKTEALLSELNRYKAISDTINKLELEHHCESDPAIMLFNYFKKEMQTKINIIYQDYLLKIEQMIIDEPIPVLTSVEDDIKMDEPLVLTDRSQSNVENSDKDRMMVIEPPKTKTSFEAITEKLASAPLVATPIVPAPIVSKSDQVTVEDDDIIWIKTIHTEPKNPTSIKIEPTQTPTPSLSRKELIDLKLEVSSKLKLAHVRIEWMSSRKVFRFIFANKEESRSLMDVLTAAFPTFEFNVTLLKYEHSHYKLEEQHLLLFKQALDKVEIAPTSTDLRIG